MIEWSSFSLWRLNTNLNNLSNLPSFFLPNTFRYSYRYPLLEWHRAWTKEPDAQPYSFRSPSSSSSVSIKDDAFLLMPCLNICIQGLFDQVWIWSQLEANFCHCEYSGGLIEELNHWNYSIIGEGGDFLPKGGSIDQFKDAQLSIICSTLL